MKPGFQCSYCDDPEAQASVAHIFADAIGGVTWTRDTVCRTCNFTVNTRVENPALKPFSYLRNFLGIPGRRGDVPVFDAFVEVPGRGRVPVKIGAGGLAPPGGMVYRVEGEKESGLIVMGEGSWVAEKLRALGERRPGGRWEEFDLPEEFTVVFEESPDRVEWRRLAVKVAFERFAQLRGSLAVKDPGFDPVRRFILDGTEDTPVCGLISDTAWTGPGGGLSFAIPNHTVLVTASAVNRFRYRLDAAVSLFGLFHFWVSLSSSFATVQPWDDLLLEHPQVGIVRHPELRTRADVPRLPWEQWASRSVREPARLREEAKTAAFEKLELAVRNASVE